jgi:preprotein translocase subunit SecF
VELFRGVNVDWLRLKWYFLAFSMIFSVAGIVSMGMHMRSIHSPVLLGVDFKGGTQVQVRFDQTPDVDKIRQATSAAGIKDATIQLIKAVDQPNSNEVLIGLPEQQDEASLDAGRQQIVDALQAHYNNHATVIKADVVGPTVGKQLEKQALLATLYSMGGMLVYLWFRFQLIYGAAAVVACLHDSLITIGAFALTNQEISLTVVAAILTLVGYSMNDTIVVFDRIRENLRLSRRESLSDVVNRSINQTLSRTVLTSGLTFLTVLSLYIFGGQVLRGFSFALVVGILIGTYSSIAIAAPMLVAWQTKTKTGAVVIALLLGYWTWSYTYEKDAGKFWVNLALCGVAPFGLILGILFGIHGFLWVALAGWAPVAWVWAVIDALRRPSDFYSGLNRSTTGTVTALPAAKRARV